MKTMRRILSTPEGVLAALILGAIVFVAIAAPWISPYDSRTMNLRERLKPPSAKHLLGTDSSGRDLLSRIMNGARVSLPAGLTIVGLACVVGCALGLFSGYFEGAIGMIIMRVTDIFVGFPALVLAIAVVAALGPGLTNGVVAVSLVWWPGYARLMHGQVLALKHETYVEAARSSGAMTSRILLRHILPNAVGPVIVKFSLDIGYAILYVAALGFLGLGAQPPTPEWGALIAEARSYTLTSPWYPIFPGLALFLAVVGFNLMGEAITEVRSK